MIGKYARLVFETEIEVGLTEEEICDKMMDVVEAFLQEQWGIDDIEIHDRPYIKDECNNNICEPGVRWELWEVDSVLHKLLKKVGLEPISNINSARVIAKELARSWCEDEEPQRVAYNDKNELWAGESDFGILIKKINS